MIPAHDADPELDFQLFDDSNPVKSGIIKPIGVLCYESGPGS